MDLRRIEGWDNWELRGRKATGNNTVIRSKVTVNG